MFQNFIQNKKTQQFIREKEEKIYKLKIFKSLNKPFIYNGIINPIIPANLFTCWHSKILPPYLNFLYESVKKGNPEFNHFCFSEDECREFIRNNFPNEVYNAYNNLIPDSYKSDLWRFCVLYINGGIYYDIKFCCANDFKFKYLLNNELFISDIAKNHIYTGLIVVKPGNQIMKNCIYNIVNNVKNKFYGTCSLDPTGPGLLGKFFTRDEYEKNLNRFNVYIDEDKNVKIQYITFNNTIIINSNDILYRICQKKFQTKPHYGELWKQRAIYLDN